MPSPVVNRFASEGVLVLGGVRAILLQVADPVVARGVAEHSGFAARPIERLDRTLSFVYAVMLGTPVQAMTLARVVDRTHDAVAGAQDPGRQLWVAATLYQTASSFYEALFEPLHPDDADEVYLAYAALGTALRVAPGDWPENRGAFERYWASALESLTVTSEARRVARELLRPTEAPWWVRAGMPAVAILTVGLLPESLRWAYGLRHRPRRYRALLATLRVLVRIVPRRIRQWPARHYLGRLPRRSPADD